MPEFANTLGFIEAGVRTTLVEPDPKSVESIKERFRELENVTLHEVALADEPGEIELVQFGASTYASTLASSPAMANDGHVASAEERFTVPAARFDSIDDGTIELLSVDIEGSEWFVLKHLASRPAVLSIELRGKRYVNPFFKEITAWLQARGYVPWFIDRSDQVFVQPGVIHVSVLERVLLVWEGLKLSARRLRYRLKGKRP